MRRREATARQRCISTLFSTPAPGEERRRACRKRGSGEKKRRKSVVENLRSSLICYHTFVSFTFNECRYGFFGTPIKKIRCYDLAPVKLRGGGEKNHRITSIEGGKKGLLDKRLRKSCATTSSFEWVRNPTLFSHKCAKMISHIATRDANKLRINYFGEFAKVWYVRRTKFRGLVPVLSVGQENQYCLKREGPLFI